MQRNRMGKTRDLFKNIGNTKGTFHTRVGTISKDLTETEEVTKRRQEYTEYKRRGLNDPNNHDGVVTHLEQDVLECESSGP